MIEDFTWTTKGPLDSPQEVLNDYVRNVNMLDIVRRTSQLIECVNGLGETYIILPVTTGSRYTHKVTFQLTEPK
jgi:hypothetical protein